jgi:fatty-acyl-CoA synthase
MAPMDVELNLGMFLQHAVEHAGDVEVVTREPDGSARRYTYADLGARAAQLMHGLDRLGIGVGEAVATLAWNHDRHLEAYFGVPCSGRILHTLNPRLAPDDLGYTIARAADRAVVVDPDFLPLLRAVPEAVSTLKAVIVIGSDDVVKSASDLPCDVIGYDDLLADQPTSYQPVEIPERSPMGICFTTGTTGRPKGVVYSHRSAVLHGMAIASGAGAAVGPGDCVCVQVPMFHANCFGMPHAAAAVGAKQVLNSGPFDPAALVDLLASERVTVSAGVPTIWQMVALDLRKRQIRLPDLRHVLTAGSQPPPSLIEAFWTEFGIPMIQAWGMTEASPVAGVAWPKNHMRDWDAETLTTRVRRQAGLPLPGISVRLRGDDGADVAWDGKSLGGVQLRGPWIIGDYLGGESGEKVGAEQFTDDGFFVTGDVAIGSPDGYVVIADRTKDLVKSGGEWISSIDMENGIEGLAEVTEAAVIAVPDVKWGERPLACVVLSPGAELSLDRVHECLAGTFARWQFPDRVEVLEALPRTSVGKIDKKALRARFAGERN